MGYPYASHALPRQCLSRSASHTPAVRRAKGRTHELILTFDYASWENWFITRHFPETKRWLRLSRTEEWASSPGPRASMLFTNKPASSISYKGLLFYVGIFRTMQYLRLLREAIIQNWNATTQMYCCFN